MDEYKTKFPYGARFGYRTPPPEFAKSYVEPLSPLIQPSFPSTMNEDIPCHQQLLPTILPPTSAPLPPPPATAAPPPPQTALFPSYAASHFGANPMPVNYAAMSPMEAFADIALSTAPPSFIASRSSPASHAPIASSSSMRSSSIPSVSSLNGAVSAAWSGDGYPTRNGNYGPGYQTTNPPPHAIGTGGFHTTYTFERRTSATRLEPPIKSPVLAKSATTADGFIFSSPPLPVAASPRSRHRPFAPVAAGFKPDRSGGKRVKRNARDYTTSVDPEVGKGAGSTRDIRGARGSPVRGRGGISNRPSSRKGRVRALSPIKDIAELEKPPLVPPKLKSTENKVSNVVVVNGKPINSPSRRLGRFPASVVESNDPPSPSPAYSPFPSRPASPANEATYITPPIPEETTVDSLPKVTAPPEDVSVAQEPEKPKTQQIFTEAIKDAVMEDVKSTVVEVLADGNINKVANEAPESLEEIVAIFSKPQESADGGAIVSDSGMAGVEIPNIGVPQVSSVENMVVDLGVAQGPEIVTNKDKTPAIELPATDIVTPVEPIAADGETVLREDAFECLTGDVPMLDDQSIEDPASIPLLQENEDFEFENAVGDEPIFGAGDVLNNGLPKEAFDTMPDEPMAAGSSGFEEVVGAKKLPILSPSGELSREPENPDHEICGQCETKYRDSYGFRLDQIPWIGCDGCGRWYHSHCLGLDGATVNRIDKFYCAPCEPKHGKSTMKRTSNRATTAIDYNALHNGSSAPIKNPTDSKLHPYVAIIRDRTHTFAEDNLPRLRPDQVTVEFLEDMSTGWNQPFVVPAKENPAPWIHNSTEDKLESNEPGSNGPEINRPESDGLESVNMPMSTEQNTTTSTGSIEITTSSIPPPPRSPEEIVSGLGGKKSKGNTPEMTLDNGNFDQTEVNRLKETLVDGEYDVKERRPGADCLDMVIPEGLTVRKVGELIGAQMRVEMINVLRQSTSKDDKWQMENLVQYFESKDREEIFNCISCEVTKTPLGALISRPEVVRKLDLSDKAWRPPNDMESKPHVGKYVLMSVADSFTDFHIDFAGSSVFYHIYEGQKVFLVIPPTDKNLEIYEQWSMNPDMNTTFFPRLVDDPCMLVTLNKGDTMFIPSGWIHAVYTPKDSLVIGGNFLTRSHYTKQMAIQRIEVVTDTKLSQRYPKYTTLMWHVLFNYLENDPIPDEIDQALAHGRIIRQKKFRQLKGKPSYTRQELEGLPDLCNFLLRSALIHCGSIKTSLRPGKPSLTGKQIDAVRRAIPAPCSEDPLKWIKKFGRWCVWKRATLKIEPNGERVPEWAQGNWVPEEGPKKGPSKAELKRLERIKIDEARRAEAPRREGLRVRNMRTSTTPGESESNEDHDPSSSKATASTPKPIKRFKRKSEGDIESANAKKRGRPSKTSLKAPNGSKPKANGTPMEDSAVKGKRKSKGKGNHTADGGDGEAFTLSDGSIYVAKESNLGPARAGCQNCRMKKTGCKHKAEIAELVARLEANGGVLPVVDKGKGKAKQVLEQELEDEEDEEDEPVLNKGKGKQEPMDDDDEDFEQAVMEDEYEEEEGHSIPEWTKESARRRSSGASSSKSQKRPRPVNDIDEIKDDAFQSLPKKVKVTKDVLTTPAQSSGVVGRPPGFQGRKPSCEECKALKTKCHHDTWHLAKMKTPAKSAKSASRRKSYGTSARGPAPGRSIADSSRRASKLASEIQRDREAFIKNDDGHEELEDVIVCKKPMIMTSAVKVTASTVVPHDNRTLSSVIVSSGPPGTPGNRRNARGIAPHTPPPLAASSTNTSPLTENEFDLDLSILDEQLPYKSRASDTPDDPAIMAPPVDCDDEPPVSITVSRVIPNGVVPAVTVSTVPSTTAPVNSYPVPAYRVHKPKVTYTRNNKNFKRKADDDDDAEGMSDMNIEVVHKQARTGMSMSPGVERRTGGTSVNGSVGGLEEGDISVEELKRLGTAADFGLRRRAGS